MIAQPSSSRSSGATAVYTAPCPHETPVFAWLRATVNSAPVTDTEPMTSLEAVTPTKTTTIEPGRGGLSKMNVPAAVVPSTSARRS